MKTLQALLLAALWLPLAALAQVPWPRGAGASPDTPLRLRFDSPPSVGSSGLVRIVDADDGRVVE